MPRTYHVRQYVQYKPHVGTTVQHGVYSMMCRRVRVGVNVIRTVRMPPTNANSEQSRVGQVRCHFGSCTHDNPKLLSCFALTNHACQRCSMVREYKYYVHIRCS